MFCKSCQMNTTLIVFVSEVFIKVQTLSALQSPFKCNPSVGSIFQFTLRTFPLNIQDELSPSITKITVRFNHQENDAHKNHASIRLHDSHSYTCVDLSWQVLEQAQSQILETHLVVMSACNRSLPSLTAPHVQPLYALNHPNFTPFIVSFFNSYHVSSEWSTLSLTKTSMVVIQLFGILEFVFVRHHLRDYLVEEEFYQRIQKSILYLLVSILDTQNMYCVIGNSNIVIGYSLRCIIFWHCSVIMTFGTHLLYLLGQKPSELIIVVINAQIDGKQSNRLNTQNSELMAYQYYNRNFLADDKFQPDLTGLSAAVARGRFSTGWSDRRDNKSRH